MIAVGVSNGVSVGDFEWCNANGEHYPNVIHVWKPENLTERRACQCVVTGQGNGLRIRYAEGDSLGTIDVPLSEIIAYARRPGDLYVHCAAGACRGPTIALLAMVARGVDPFQALACLYQADWVGRRIAPTLVQVPVQEILAWWEGQRGPIA